MSSVSICLNARYIRRYGLRRGSYNGANKRRFVLFADTGNGTEMRYEFNTRRERDIKALGMLRARIEFERKAERLEVGR